MSSDLLAEFDSFYRSSQDHPPNPAPASSDISFQSGEKGDGQIWQGVTQSRWSAAPEKLKEDIWGGVAGFVPSKPTLQPNIPDDDIWGSFEVPGGKKAGQEKPTSNTTYYGGIMAKDPGSSILQNKNPDIVRGSMLDLFSNDKDIATQPSSSRRRVQPESLPAPKPTASTKSSYGVVLFDADELSGQPEEDDEFGDFETVTTPSGAVSQPLDNIFVSSTFESKLTRLTDLSTTSSPLPYPQAPKPPSFQSNPFTGIGLTTKSIANMKLDENPNTASSVTIWPTFEPKEPQPARHDDSATRNNPLDGDWGDFLDLPAETPAPKLVKEDSLVEAEVWDLADKVPETVPIAESAPPPTNIPPPSVLLMLFPTLLDLPQSTLFQAMSNQPFSLKNRILSDASTIKFLRAYLLIATVAARVIAGRKLRWRRDPHLSQAMKIGPAAAGGKGGMKLTGIDKAETKREERESAEVLRAWKDQIGRLRSAVAAANSSNHDVLGHLIIPEITEAMHIRTLRFEEGAMTAPNPCVICGLNRDERITNVDIDIQIEDSFGEWWIDHWGHRACRNFWLEQESTLKSR